MVRLSWLLPVALLYSADAAKRTTARPLICPKGVLTSMAPYKAGTKFAASDCPGSVTGDNCAKLTTWQNDVGKVLYAECVAFNTVHFVKDYLEWLLSMCEEVKTTNQKKKDFHKINKNLRVCLLPLKFIPIALVKIPAKLAHKAIGLFDKKVKLVGTPVPKLKRKLFPGVTGRIKTIHKKVKKVYDKLEKAIKKTQAYMAMMVSLFKGAGAIADVTKQQAFFTKLVAGIPSFTEQFNTMSTYGAEWEAKTTKPKDVATKGRTMGELLRTMMINGRYPLELWNQAMAPANTGCNFLTSGLKKGTKIWMPVTYPITCVAALKALAAAKRAAAAALRAAQAAARAFASLCSFCRRLSSSSGEDSEKAEHLLVEAVKEPSSEVNAAMRELITKGGKDRAWTQLKQFLTSSRHSQERRRLLEEVDGVNSEEDGEIQPVVPVIAGRAARRLGETISDGEKATLLAIEAAGQPQLEKPLGMVGRVLDHDDETTELHSQIAARLDRDAGIARSFPQHEQLDQDLAFAELVDLETAVFNGSRTVRPFSYPDPKDKANWHYDTETRRLSYKFSPRHLVDIDDAIPSGYDECKCGSSKGVITKGVGICFHGTPMDVVKIADGVMSQFMAPVNAIIDALVGKTNWGPKTMGDTGFKSSNSEKLIAGVELPAIDFGKMELEIKFQDYLTTASDLEGDPAFWPDDPSFDMAKLTAAIGVRRLATSVPFPGMIIKGCTDKHAITYNPAATEMVTETCEYKCYATCFGINGDAEVATATDTLPTCAAATGGFDFDVYANENSGVAGSKCAALMAAAVDDGICTYEDVQTLKNCPQTCCYIGWRKSLINKKCDDYHSDCISRAASATGAGQSICAADKDYLHVECGPACLHTGCKNYEGSPAQESAKAKLQNSLKKQGCTDLSNDCPFYGRKGYCTSTTQFDNPNADVWKTTKIPYNEAGKYYCPITCEYKECAQPKLGQCTFDQSSAIYTMMDGFAANTCKKCADVLADLQQMHEHLVMWQTYTSDLAKGLVKGGATNKTAMQVDYLITDDMINDLTGIYDGFLKVTPTKATWLKISTINPVCNCPASSTFADYFDSLAECFVADNLLVERRKVKARTTLQAACADIAAQRAAAGCLAPEMKEFGNRGDQLFLHKDYICRETFAHINALGDFMSGHTTCPTQGQVENSDFPWNKLCTCALATDIKEYFNLGFSCLSYIKTGAGTTCDFKVLLEGACAAKGFTISSWPASQYVPNARSDCMDYNWHIDQYVKFMQLTGANDQTWNCQTASKSQKMCWGDVPNTDPWYQSNTTMRGYLNEGFQGLCKRTCWSCKPFTYYQPQPQVEQDLKIGFEHCNASMMENCLQWKVSGNTGLLKNFGVRMLGPSYFANGLETDYGFMEDVPPSFNSFANAENAGNQISAALLRPDQACSAAQHGAGSCPKITSANGAMMSNVYFWQDKTYSGAATAGALPGLIGEQKMCWSKVTVPGASTPAARCPNPVTFKKGTEYIHIGAVGECEPGVVGCKMYINMQVEIYDGYDQKIIMNGIENQDLLTLVTEGKQAEGVTSLRFKDSDALSKDVEMVFDTEVLHADVAAGAAYGGNPSYKSAKVIVARRTIAQNEGAPVVCEDENEVKNSFKIQISIDVPGKDKFSWWGMRMGVTTAALSAGTAPTIVTTPVAAVVEADAGDTRDTGDDTVVIGGGGTGGGTTGGGTTGGGTGGTTTSVAKKITGVMKTSYPNMDATAAAEFIKDTKVKAAYEETIAEAISVPKDRVTVTLGVETTRRLMNEPRRLASTITASYEITVPAGDANVDSAAVAADLSTKLKAKSAADMQTALKAKMTAKGVDAAVVADAQVTEALTATVADVATGGGGTGGGTASTTKKGDAAGTRERVIGFAGLIMLAFSTFSTFC